MTVARRLLVLGCALTLILSFVAFSGCQTSASSNHTIALANFGSNDSVHAAQFTYMKISPVDNSQPEKEFSFVLSPNETTKINIHIPENGYYKITLALSKGGPTIWWNRIALGIDGTTKINLEANNRGWADNSKCNSMPPSGCNIY